MLQLYRYLLLAALAFALITTVRAQMPGDWRGAWIVDVDGQRQVLYLVLREGKVSGFQCFDCANPANLAFVDEGSLDDQGLHFKLFHSTADGNTTIESVDGVLTDGALVLTRQWSADAATTLTMHRAPLQAEPPPIADSRPNQPSGGRPRSLPGNAELVTADKVVGLWLWGSGPTKQYFIFKRHKEGLRGMVCGPCDSAKDFAPLENITMDGTKLHFDIVHEDNGIGFEQHGPFSNVTDAQISLNEMHMNTWSSFDPQGRKYEMTLLGPVQFMPANVK